MRYNGKELSWLARQPRGFQREGNLFVGNVPPGSLLHRRPVLSERWGRLRGNLLFLLKSRDKESDADEVVVLERCVICTDNDGTNCGLTISFPGPGVSLYLEASGRSERDAWSRALGRAGAEALAVRVAALRAAISGLRGLDPRAPGTPGTPHPPGPREGGNPALELSIACRGLPCGPGDSPPSPFARVYVYVYSRRALAPTWTLHSHTETIEATCAPEFLVSAAFFPAPRPLRICVSVCDSRDRSGPDGVKVLGKVECSVEELLRGGGKLSLPLKSEQGVSAGEVRLQVWASDSGEETVASSPLLGPRGIPEWRAKRYHSLLHDEFLRTMFCNECVRTYRVPGHVEAPLRPLLAVQERMAESRLSFHVPRQLLQMRLRQLSAWLSLLQSVDPLLPARVEERRQRLLALGTEQVEAYTEALTSLHAHHGPNFKASRLRRERALSFVPINLHVQRLRVQDAHTRRDCTYDVVTVGAPAAHVLGFKGGGLRSLMARGARLGVLGEQDEMRSLLQRLWKLKLRFDSHHASLAASPLTTEELSTHLAHLVDTTQQLVSLCEREAVCDAVLRLARSESQETRLSATTAAAAAAAAGSSTSSTLRVASRREWRLLLSRVEEELELLLLSSGPEHDLRARVSLLAPRVCAACDGACRALLAIALESEACWGSSLSQRRDVVDSHTLSALVVGCVLRLRAGLGDAAFLQQLQHAGLLVCFESLLSTYGDEQAMLEDMAVSVMDLSHRVSLRLTLSPPGSEGDSLLPSLTEDGEGCVVSVPLPAAMFRTLPEPLRDGALVPVSSALFSIGINEQQTLVERFHGDTSLQEQLCVESCERLRAYHKLACAYLPSPEPRGDAPPPWCWRPLPELLEELAKSAASRRNKNVHVLQVAAQVCQRLRGVRVTSCKSAKDRTAMSVTLEQCALLRDRHGLPASTFSAALNCMRSEGCRLENAAKNVGCRRYAFHTLQLATFPRFYRPPEGTYGKVDT
ncbi:LOW QUALITY PROTEIN: inositol polyphosphate-4-phosphatase type I A-like [Lampetra planeri]